MSENAANLKQPAARKIIAVKPVELSASSNAVRPLRERYHRRTTKNLSLEMDSPVLQRLEQ